MEAPLLSIIIPAHNEALRLPQTLEQIRAYLLQRAITAEVLVVENASTDDTAAVVREWQEGMPQLRLIELKEAGKGNAIRHGMQAACGKYRLMADADLSMPIEDTDKFLEAAQQGAQVIIASRELPGSKRVGEPLKRHLVGRIFNLLVRWVALPGLQDTQCGFKCFEARAAEQIFSKQTLSGWSFDVEVLVIAREMGYQIVEVPITWVYNAGTRISVLRDSFKMARDLWHIRSNAKQGLYRGEKV